MKKYICSKCDNTGWDRTDVMRTQKALVCPTHRCIISHVVMTCSDCPIVITILVAQAAHQVRCTVCTKDRKRVLGKEYARQKRLENGVVPIKKRSELKFARKKRPDGPKRTSCIDYNHCNTTAALSGIGFSCNRCGEYWPRPADDPADYLGSGNTANSMMGRQVRREAGGRGWI